MSTGTFQDGAQVVAQGANAVALRVLELAVKAALSTLEVNVIEVYEFCLCPCSLAQLHYELCIMNYPVLSG